MNLLEAYLAGISGFFSAWIFCLLQIIPFFLAFIVADSLAAKDGDGSKPKELSVKRVSATLLSLAGYLVVFTLLGMTTTGISKLIFSYLDIATQFGGVVLGLVGLYFVGLLTFYESSAFFKMLLKPLFAVLFGVSLALAYKPCVTPALTIILNLNNHPETAAMGGLFLAGYALGTVTVIFLAGVGLSFLAKKLLPSGGSLLLKKFCGIIIVGVSVLVLSGNMTSYKSFLVGRFVPHVSMEDMEHKGMDHKHMDGEGSH